MSDIGDDFKAMKEFNRAKKVRNLEFATQYLIDNDISFESKNAGIHLIVKSNSLTIDYWPSTGLFNIRVVNYKGRGINALVGIVKGTNIPKKLKAIT